MAPITFTINSFIGVCIPSPLAPPEVQKAMPFPIVCLTGITSQVEESVAREVISKVAAFETDPYERQDATSSRTQA